MGASLMSRNKSVNRATKRLLAIPKEVRESLIKSNMEAAEETASLMRRFVPEDTGALRDSIAVTPGGGTTPAYSQGGAHVVPDNQVVITTGNSAVRYGHLVEWGTSDTDAQPFFYPVIRSVMKKMIRKLRASARKAVKEAGK